MDRSSVRMRRFLLIGFYACLLSLFAQLVAPAATMAMERAVDPFTIICTHAPSGPGDPPADHHHDHQHCLLCHAYLGGPTLDARPAFTAFDFPVASPRRWAIWQTGTRVKRQDQATRPRGPPAFI